MKHIKLFESFNKNADKYNDYESFIEAIKNVANNGLWKEKPQLAKPWITDFHNTSNKELLGFWDNNKGYGLISTGIYDLDKITNEIINDELNSKEIGEVKTNDSEEAEETADTMSDNMVGNYETKMKINLNKKDREKLCKNIFDLIFDRIFDEDSEVEEED